MTPQEIIRAKNIDLLINQYNNEVMKVNRDGFIDMNSRKVKSLKNRYENIIARFDTDKMTTCKKDIYKYKHSLDGNRLVGIRGVKPTIPISGEQ